METTNYRSPLLDTDGHLLNEKGREHIKELGPKCVVCMSNRLALYTFLPSSVVLNHFRLQALSENARFNFHSFLLTEK